MNNIVHLIAKNDALFIFGILVFFGLTEAAFGYFTSSKRSKDDVLTETINALVLFVITKPIVVFIGLWLMRFLFPSQEKVFTSLPFWLSTRGKTIKIYA